MNIKLEKYQQERLISLLKLRLKTVPIIKFNFDKATSFIENRLISKKLILNAMFQVTSVCYVVLFMFNLYFDKSIKRTNIMLILF